MAGDTARRGIAVAWADFARVGAVGFDRGRIRCAVPELAVLWGAFVAMLEAGSLALPTLHEVGLRSTPTLQIVLAVQGNALRRTTHGAFAGC